MGRPAALVVNKMDTSGAVAKLQELVTKLNETKGNQCRLMFLSQLKVVYN